MGSSRRIVTVVAVISLWFGVMAPARATDNDTDVHWHTAPLFRISTTFPNEWVDPVKRAATEWRTSTRYNIDSGNRIATTGWRDETTHIIWHGTIPSQWQADCPPGTTIACTSTRYQTSDRHIIDADMVYGPEWTYSTDDLVCDLWGMVVPDVEFVALHEFGHFGGLVHTSDQAAVMYGTLVDCRRSPHTT